MRPPIARLAPLGALILVTTSPSADEGKPMAAITARLTALRSAGGKVGCALYDQPRGFPQDASRARQRRWCGIEGGAAACAFAPVPAGAYAVACFHDENDNGRCDTGWLGIPTEGTVVSNHARGTLGPPSFEAARFVVTGPTAELALRVSY